MFLLDSDYLINFLNGQEKAVKTIKSLRHQPLYTSIICVAEVLEGLYLTKNRKKASQFEKFLDTMWILEVDFQVARYFALTRVKLRKQGKLIDNLDLLIATTCLAYNLSLVTDNLAHFRRIPGLKIYQT